MNQFTQLLIAGLAVVALSGAPLAAQEPLHLHERAVLKGPPDDEIRPDPRWFGRVPMYCGPLGRVRTLAWGSDGKVLTSSHQGPIGSTENCVRLWDTTTNQEANAFAPSDLKPNVVYGLRLTPDGKKLIAPEESVIRTWDAVTGKQLATWKTEYTSGIAVCPDGKQMASWSYRGDVRVWDLPTGKSRVLLKPFHNDLNWMQVLYSPDGKTLAVSYGSPTGKPATNRILLLDAATDKEKAQCEFKGAIDVHTVAFSPDSKQIAAGGWCGGIRVWDVATGKEAAKLKLFDAPDEHYTRHAVVDSLAWSPNGKVLAVGTRQGNDLPAEIRLWEVATGKTETMIPPQIRPVNVISEGSISALAWSPDGKRLASGEVFYQVIGLIGNFKILASKGAIRLWDVSNERNPERPPPKQTGVDK